MIKNIIVFCILFFIIIITVCISFLNVYKNSYIYGINKKNNLYNLNTFYSVTLYKSNYDSNQNFMIIINPQKYHFFIEKDILIYHPREQDGILKKYSCPSFYELVYNFDISNNDDLIMLPKVFCHLNLNYLKTYIYNIGDALYTINLNEITNPLIGIKKIIHNVLKNTI